MKCIVFVILLGIGCCNIEFKESQPNMLHQSMIPHHNLFQQKTQEKDFEGYPEANLNKPYRANKNILQRMHSKRPVSQQKRNYENFRENSLKQEARNQHAPAKNLLSKRKSRMQDKIQIRDHTGYLKQNFKRQQSLQYKRPSKNMLYKIKSTKTPIKTKRMAIKTKGFNLAGYPQAILSELNIYRRKEHYYPYIRWLKALSITAQREARHIVGKSSFGEHANFQTWKRHIRNNFFTELSLHIDTEGMHPPKRIFAKTILESLKQEKEWYLIHPYTHAGIAILPSRRKGHYVVVIHLQRMPIFHSCREAQLYEITTPTITITNGGKKYIVHCDQKTVGGGWTMVLYMRQQSFGAVHTAINDRGMSYSQLLFRTLNHYWFDYARGGGGNANAWDFNGYCFSLNALRFNNLWYMSRQSPSHNGGGERGKIPKTLYDVNNHYLHILRGANKCMFGRTNRPEYCAKEFVLKRLPGGRLNAISDVETIIRKWTGDNQWNQYYQIFLR